MNRPVRLVVGAAIVRGGRLLAARRTTPPETAGRWELPGGKVEPGETPDAALVREIGEELGCLVAVESWLGGEQWIEPVYVLRVALCHLEAGEPTPGTDHDALQWLSPVDLDDLDWLEPDRPFLTAVRALLLGSAP